MSLLSRFLTAKRHERIIPYVRGDVLDLGCGDARTLELYGDKVTSYCGIERGADKVDTLRSRFPQATFLERNLDLESLNLAGSFDCVLMLAIIEHLFNQRFVMEQVREVLNPEGVVLITTPTPLGNDVVHRIGARVGLFAQSAADDHIVVYNRHRFRILARETGLRLRHHEYFQIWCNQFVVLGR